jgi:hypothetical protein
VVGGAWGGGAKEHHLEGNHYPVQLYVSPIIHLVING